MLPEEVRPLAERLNAAFRQSMSIYGATAPTAPIWYGLALSDLVILLEGQEVRYATATYRSDERSARFLVVSDQMVVDLHVTGIDGQLSHRELLAVPRSDLIALSIEAGETVFSQSAFSDWPGSLTVTAHYANLSSPAVFPLERTQGSRDQERELLATLRSDLLGN